ncbi:MAG: hypothetical protein Q4P11_05050 [Methanobrevibacter sp.]|nr:hypothetical protein [Methanobrevibacter sp.]
MVFRDVCLSPFIGFILGSVFIIELCQFRYPADYTQSFMFCLPYFLKFIVIILVVALILTALTAIYDKIRNNPFEKDDLLMSFASIFIAMMVGLLLATFYWYYRLTYDFQSLPEDLRLMVNSTDISMLYALSGI